MRNKLLFIIAFVFASAFTISAQEYEARYGFRVGANYSNINSSEITDGLDESRLGAMAGFLAEYPFTSLISVQPELQYSAQGNLDKELRLNYIQLPILVKFNITEMFNVHIGPQAGFKVWEWERNENFNTFEFSAIAGLGINITDGFFADLRYSFGFTDVFEKEIFGEGIKAEGNNGYIQLSLGYRL